MSSLTPEVLRWLRQEIYDVVLDVVPLSIATIDRDFNVVDANRTYEETFGPWEGRKCYRVYKGIGTSCDPCSAALIFDDHQPRVSVHETGENESGNVTRYVKHSFPVPDASGRVDYIVEMSFDLERLSALAECLADRPERLADRLEAEKLRRQNLLLFERAPCSMTLLDSDLRIRRANAYVRRTFGEAEGRYCYDVFKGRDDCQGACEGCLAMKSLADGEIHTGHSLVRNRRGEEVHLQITMAPVAPGPDGRPRVMEMAVDVTKSVLLKKELGVAHAYLGAMVSSSLDGIVALDESQDVVVVNPAARGLFGLADGAQIDFEQLSASLPEGFIERVLTGEPRVCLHEAIVRTVAGDEIPVRLVGARLEQSQQRLGMAIYIADQTKVKQLEREKLDAERLAAVGQTVAGLAHGIKNLLTGLEGGMYMMGSGLERDDRDRMAEGRRMLERNIARVTSFVKDFLSFAKGRKIGVRPVQPGAVAHEVVQLYADKAERAGIELTCEVADGLADANLDYEAMHECLTNLIGNAIDACQTSDAGSGGHVVVRVFEREGVVMYEVQDDGCGMDYAVKRKVFTSFFTTKGLGGTGLGLLTTRKHVQEHGGSISVESAPKQGTTFSIRLPRGRLPSPTNEPLGED